MATQTFSRAQNVLGALRNGHFARPSVAVQAAFVSRSSQATVFAPQRAVSVRSRKASTITAAAGNGAVSSGLPIDLRGTF